MKKELLERLKQLRKRFVSRRPSLCIEEKHDEFIKLQKQIEQPDFWNDKNAAEKAPLRA